MEAFHSRVHIELLQETTDLHFSHKVFESVLQGRHMTIVHILIDKIEYLLEYRKDQLRSR